jgi:dihydroneopterin aldolase
MIGTIELQRLSISCIVGILDFERVTAQEIFLDVSMDMDFAAAAESEDIHETVNYTDVAKELTQLVQTRKYLLIETMVEECAALVLERWSSVQTVRMAVHKPAAVPQAQDTIVRVERSR